MEKTIRKKYNIWMNVHAIEDNHGTGFSGIIRTNINLKYGKGRWKEVRGVCFPFESLHDNEISNFGKGFFYGTINHLDSNFRRYPDFDSLLGSPLDSFTDYPLPSTMSPRQQEYQTFYKIPLPVFRDKLLDAAQKNMLCFLEKETREKMPSQLGQMEKFEIDINDKESLKTFFAYFTEFPHGFKAEALRQGHFFHCSGNSDRKKSEKIALPDLTEILTPMGGQPGWRR